MLIADKCERIIEDGSQAAREIAGKQGRFARGEATVTLADLQLRVEQKRDEPVAVEASRTA